MDDPEVVLEKEFSRYRLPDAAIDLEAWLKDGLEVYNIFVLMKPTFFQMLQALGGTFESSMQRANEDRLKNRIHFKTRYVEDKDGVILDQIIELHMESREEGPELVTEIKEA